MHGYRLLKGDGINSVCKSGISKESLKKWALPLWWQFLSKFITMIELQSLRGGRTNICLAIKHKCFRISYFWILDLLRYLTVRYGKYSVLKFRFQVLFIVNWANAHSFIRIHLTQWLDPIENICLPFTIPNRTQWWMMNFSSSISPSSGYSRVGYEGQER